MQNKHIKKYLISVLLVMIGLIAMLGFIIDINQIRALKQEIRLLGYANQMYKLDNFLANPDK